MTFWAALNSVMFIKKKLIENFLLPNKGEQKQFKAEG